MRSITDDVGIRSSGLAVSVGIFFGTDHDGCPPGTPTPTRRRSVTDMGRRTLEKSQSQAHTPNYKFHIVTCPRKQVSSHYGHTAFKKDLLNKDQYHKNHS